MLLPSSCGTSMHPARGMWSFATSQAGYELGARIENRGSKYLGMMRFGRLMLVKIENQGWQANGSFGG
jgi:hypothetical protein